MLRLSICAGDESRILFATGKPGIPMEEKYIARVFRIFIMTEFSGFKRFLDGFMFTPEYVSFYGAAYRIDAAFFEAKTCSDGFATASLFLDTMDVLNYGVETPIGSYCRPRFLESYSDVKARSADCYPIDAQQFIEEHNHMIRRYTHAHHDLDYKDKIAPWILGKNKK
jgi:hypothetical protein